MPALPKHPGRRPRAPRDSGYPLSLESRLGVLSRMERMSRQAQWHGSGSCDARIGTPFFLTEKGVVTIQTRKKESMSDEEIAVRLAAAILQPSVVIPARRASIEENDEQLQHAAGLAVRVYRAVLGVLQPPASP